MDESKLFSKKRSGNFDKKSKIGKRHNSSIDEAAVSSADTIYRILCPVSKIDAVIGDGCEAFKSLRKETHAKIKVSDAIHGSDEQVIIIYSSPVKIPRRNSASEGFASENEDDKMEPHCAAQGALLKVHDRIVEEGSGGMPLESENDINLVTARLLVPKNMVVCLLGKKGRVSRRLRIKTGATICLLSSENIPTCAMNMDELLQISGKPDIVKNALFVVSTLLHENPCNGKPNLRCYLSFYCGIVGKSDVTVKQLQHETDASVHVEDPLEESEGRDIRVTKVEKFSHRVKADEVIFADQRLGDNSYWAKGGAENGYGAKAQAILGQVKGRNFRHEKTKKKKGNYRGGQIDQQSHSIKFNYSDED